MTGTEYEIERIVRVLDTRLSDINDRLKDIEKELRIANIALSREATIKKGAGQSAERILAESEEKIQKEEKVE